MPKVQVSTCKKDPKRLLEKQKTSEIHEHLNAGSSGSGAQHSNYLSKAKNLIKSLSKSASQSLSGARCLINTDLSIKDIVSDSPSSLNFSSKECYKEYESWEDMMTEVDRNINNNFDIRCKYDAGRPIKVNPPKQNYYYVEGFGLITDKFLPDLKELQRTNGLNEVKSSNKVQPIYQSKTKGNLQSNAFLNENISTWDYSKK